MTRSASDTTLGARHKLAPPAADPLALRPHGLLGLALFESKTLAGGANLSRCTCAQPRLSCRRRPRLRGSDPRSLAEVRHDEAWSPKLVADSQLPAPAWDRPAKPEVRAG